ISFNSVFRDHDVIWNISDLPFSLVFFAHRNPVDRAAGFSEKKDERESADGELPQRTTTGTHDVLLHRDIFESLLYAAFDQGRFPRGPAQGAGAPQGDGLLPLTAEPASQGPAARVQHADS